MLIFSTVNGILLQFQLLNYYVTVSNHIRMISEGSCDTVLKIQLRSQE